MSAEKFIDVEKLIASKSDKALKYTPRFLVRYLKRIVHEKEINEFILANKDKKNAEWCQATVDELNIRISVKHLDRIPKTGKIVIAMNHPLGGMDAMILVSALRGHREDLKFIVNDILLSLENMREMFIGVDKVRRNDSSLRVQIDDVFKSDNAVCIFPAGLVSRRTKGEIRDLDWKKTFVTYSKKYDRTIVPVYIDGRLSNFFYRLANLRKFLGIKANIEMLYLANELFKQRNRHMQFVVGTPITPDMMKDWKSDREIAREVKERVYELRKEL